VAEERVAAMGRWNPKERRTSRRRFNQGKWHVTQKGYVYFFFNGRWRPVVMENGERFTSKGWKELYKK
jgi:hypothetical protein